MPTAPRTSVPDRPVRTILLLASSAILLAAEARTQAPPILFPRPLSDRIANYSIDVSLDPARKTLTGHETLAWRNTSPVRISELQFHLYLNAFRDEHSTFLHGRRPRATDTGEWGWIEIRSLKTARGEILTDRIEFIHPDDDNTEDRTVIRIPLSHPVPPGESVTLTCDFTAQLPAVIARTGYAGEFFMVGQWFPKIGVYEPGRGWNCHQYHPTTEFFADFGVYDVAITLPDRFLVGATGLRYAETRHPDGTTTVRYHAEDVHDFAWTASPRFVEVHATWRQVSLRLLVQPEHLSQASRYLGSCEAALEYFDRHVGPYPYPALTIVDPPAGGAGAGGMEYPTFFTVETAWGTPTGLRFPELVTIHEFGHQYWQGMSANNEFEEAWLDEGVNQYFEARITSATYGEKTSFLNLGPFHAGDAEFIRNSYYRMRNPWIAPPATPAWQFPAGAYAPVTYDKVAITLLTLERMIGSATMDSVIRAFFHRWRFHHPGGRDFTSAFGPAWREFFEQTIFGTAVCDFEVTAIINAPPASPTDSGATRTANVVVSRRGDMILPVDILIVFADGREVRERWDGRSPSITFTYRNPVRRAVVDPEGKILLDANLVNNSRSVEAQPAAVWKYAVRVLFWFQNLMHLAGLIG